MHPYQRMAWVNLGASLLFVLSLPVIYLLTGRGAFSVNAAFGLFLLAHFALFFTGRQKEKSPQWDEYHTEVTRRARDVAGIAFISYCGLCYAFIIMRHSGESIPFEVFLALPGPGWVTFAAAHSLTTLVVYNSDRTERRTLLDSWRGLSNLQHYGIAGLGSIGIFLAVYWLTALRAGNGSITTFHLLGMDIVLLWLYLFNMMQMKKIAVSTMDLKRLARAKKASLIAIMVAGVFVSGFLVLLTAKQGELLPNNVLAGILFVILAAMLFLFLAAMLPISGDNRERVALFEEKTENATTFYLGGDPNAYLRTVWAQALVFIFFGLFYQVVGTLHFGTLFSAVFLTMAVLLVLFRKKIILFITFSPDNIRARTSIGGIKETAWSDLARIELKFTEAWLFPQAPAGETIKLKLGGYESAKRLKTLFREYGANRGVEVLG